MTMTDPIADMLTRVRNANSAGKPTVAMPSSKKLVELARIMQEEGYIQGYDVVGVGYRAALKGKDLEMQLGFSHPVLVEAPENITFEVPSQTEIIVSGPSKEQVGQVAANIRAWRKPEPYKGKGIRYEGEYVRRKLGKAAKSD